MKGELITGKGEGSESDGGEGAASLQPRPPEGFWPMSLLMPFCALRGTGPGENAAGQVPARSHQPGLPILARCAPAAGASR